MADKMVLAWPVPNLDRLVELIGNHPIRDVCESCDAVAVLLGSSNGLDLRQFHRDTCLHARRESRKDTQASLADIVSAIGDRPILGLCADCGGDGQLRLHERNGLEVLVEHQKDCPAAAAICRSNDIHPVD